MFGASRARVTAKDLQVNCWKVVVGIGIELALKLRQWLRLDARACSIWIAQLVGNTVDPGIYCLQRPQHVIKRPILHHQHHDVLKLIQSS